MIEGAIQLNALNLAVAAALVLVAGAVSVGLRLRMEHQLALASVRTVVQLLLVGYILRAVFRLSNLYALAGVVLVMLFFASRTAVTRPKWSYRGAGLQAFATLFLTGMTVILMVTAVIIGVDPWWEPRYLIPLLGMILGNGMTAISLCLDRLLTYMSDRRDLVEMELSLGATAWEAARTPISDAVRSGMIPIINTMMVAGVVSLPGMMTGQILAGADPLDAVKYQIVVMFMLAAATALGSILMALLVFRRLFNSRHQLRGDVIRER